jgi:hypothetical protein
LANNDNVSKVRIQFLIFFSPFDLHGKNFLIKQALNKRLELFKLLKNLIFVLKQIDPSEFTIIINKADIILISSKIDSHAKPHTSENISSTLCLLASITH